MNYSDIIEQQGLVIVYQQDKPQLFINSVEQFTEYSNANPEFRLEYDTNIIFQDENKNVLAEYFEDSKALCIKIAQQPEFKQAFIKLTQAIIRTSEHHDYELSNIDCEHNHGEDLMFGLIAMGPGEHALLIEDWMLGIDWSHEVEQDDVISSAIESWGATKESCRLAVLRISLCGGQHGDESFDHSMAKITEDESVWDLFCQSAVALSERITQLNNFRNEEYQFPPIYLWLMYEHTIEKRNILRIKLTSHLMQNSDQCAAYFKELLSLGRSQPYKVKKQLDLWYYHAESKGFIKQTIRQLFNAHWTILNELDCEICWEEQIKKIQSLQKTLTGISLDYANVFIRFLEWNIKLFSKKPYTKNPDQYKKICPELADHPHVFSAHTTDEGNDTFIIAYDPDQPNLFKLSVERLAAYLDANQEATISDLTTLYFCNFKGEIIASHYTQTKALCIEIATTKELKSTYIFLCKILMDRLIDFPNHGYIDEENTHGEDLIYGLIAMGKGAHSSIIEDWMLSVDWDHDVEQFMTVSEIFEWGDCIPYYRTEFLSLTACVSQSIVQSHLPESLNDPENFADFCDAAMQIKYKLDNYNYRYQPFGHYTYNINEHLHYGFFRDNIESEKMYIKVIVHITESTNELIQYFDTYIRDEPSIEEFLEHLDDWSAQLDGTKDNLLKLIKSMKNTFKRFHKEFSKASDRDALEAKFRELKNNCPEEHPERELMLEFILQAF